MPLFASTQSDFCTALALARPLAGCRILVAAQLGAGSTSWSRTKALGQLVGAVESVNMTPFIEGLGLWRQALTNHLYAGAGVDGLNRLLLRQAAEFQPHILWVDKGLHLRPSTLEQIRGRNCTLLVHFSPDNQMVGANQSRHYLKSIPLYNVQVTTKPHNVDWLYEQGAARVELVGKGFDPDLHRPVELNAHERTKYECDLGFVGHWEPSREELLFCLWESGYRIRVWGGGWKRARRRTHPLFAGAVHLTGDEYAKALCGAKINLCLLSQWFGDRTTARSIEIPACGSFMLAERTPEHEELFREGIEAEFYGSRDEMRAKIDRYLLDERRRLEIGAAGRLRCLHSYSNAARLKELFGRLELD